MKIFLMREEKQEFKRLRKIERSHKRRMTNEEFRKIEEVETFIDNRRCFIFSIVSLFVSVFSFILVVLSRL